MFYSSLKNKELFDLIFSKIISGGGDFLRIIEIALVFHFTCFLLNLQMYHIILLGPYRREEDYFCEASLVYSIIFNWLHKTILFCFINYHVKSSLQRGVL